MDLNAVTSWSRLRELLENSECVHQRYLPASNACIKKNSDAYLLERAAFFKRKHCNNREPEVRLGVITKEMNTYATAIYKAWEQMATHQAEYDALLEVQKDYIDTLIDRENAARARIAIREDAAAKNRAITLQVLNKRGINLGGKAEDDADAREDEKAEIKARKAQAKEDAENKEADRKSAIRTHVLMHYTLEQATKLLKVLKNLSSQEAEAFLRTVHNEKSVKKAPPPPPPIVQPHIVQPSVAQNPPVMHQVAPSTSTAKKPTVLNALLDRDEYDVRSPRRKKNRDVYSSESDGDVIPDSPSKEQRINELSSSMSTVDLAATQNA